MPCIKIIITIQAASSILRVPSLKPTNKTLSDHEDPVRPWRPWRRPWRPLRLWRRPWRPWQRHIKPFLSAYVWQRWNSISLDLLMCEQNVITVRQKAEEFWFWSLKCIALAPPVVLFWWTSAQLTLTFFKYTKRGDDWLKLTPPLITYLSLG